MEYGLLASLLAIASVQALTDVGRIMSNRFAMTANEVGGAELTPAEPPTANGEPAPNDYGPAPDSNVGASGGTTNSSGGTTTTSGGTTTTSGGGGRGGGGRGGGGSGGGGGRGGSNSSTTDPGTDYGTSSGGAVEPPMSALTEPPTSTSTGSEF